MRSDSVGRVEVAAADPDLIDRPQAAGERQDALRIQYERGDSFPKDSL